MCVFPSTDPHEFPSNPVYVAVLFTGDQMLNKIEVTFMVQYQHYVICYI